MYEYYIGQRGTFPIYSHSAKKIFLLSGRFKFAFSGRLLENTRKPEYDHLLLPKIPCSTLWQITLHIILLEHADDDSNFYKLLLSYCKGDDNPREKEKTKKLSSLDC